MNSTSQLGPETSAIAPPHAREASAAPHHPVRLCPGNAPQTLWDYLLYPRVLLTAIICAVSTALHIGFGIYMWLFAD